RLATGIKRIEEMRAVSFRQSATVVADRHDRVTASANRRTSQPDSDLAARIDRFETVADHFADDDRKLRSVGPGPDRPRRAHTDQAPLTAGRLEKAVDDRLG